MKFHLDCQLKKALTRSARSIGSLLLVLSGILFTVMAYGGSGALGANELLSTDERVWLEKNQPRLVLAVETGYAPFVFIDSNGQPTGLAHDYIRLIETKLGVQFNQKRFSSLDGIFQKVRGGEVQIVNAITNTPARAKFLSITEPFISVPNVIIVRNDRPGKMAEYDLQGLKVSLVKSYAITEHMGNRGLKLTADIVPDDLSALLNVSFGRSDAAVIDLATASYLISQKGIANLRVAGEVTYDIRLSLGTPLDEPVLYGILQKGLSAITDAERQEIKSRWISASKQQSIFQDRQFWIVLGSVLAVAFAIFAIILVWNRTLRRQIALRKQAEMVARASEERLKEAQRISQIGNWELDLVNNKLLWSDEIFRLFEIEPDKFPATYEGFLNAIHPEDRDAVNQAYTSSLENHEPYEITHRLLMPDGRIKWVTERCHSYFDEAGKPIRSVGTVQDVTLRKQSEQALAQSNADLERFAYSVSHDMRQPLRAISGHLQLLQHSLKGKLDDDERQNLGFALEGAKRMDSMIVSLLEYSRIGRKTKAMQWVASRVALDEALGFLEVLIAESGAGVKVTGEWPQVYASRDELTRLLQNLIGNAIKFRLPEQPAQVEINSSVNGATWRVSVRDYGVGIDPHQTDRLFQFFSRLQSRGRFEGSGMGLALCRRIVEHHGGHIWVESEGENKGSVFIFEIPLDGGS